MPAGKRKFANKKSGKFRRSKAKPKKNKSTSNSDSGPQDRAPPPKKEDAVDDKINNYQWSLENQRQVRVNDFLGKKLIDIRIYYEKNGELLPGRVGISLSVTQWKKLLEYRDEINAAVQDEL
ncbi:RNA polymerase II transcriptional coactivator-like [Musca autumnalis]|uniref:RNA polymerase II transcriptional coactivator-like n=1 Tax=Musca autumnalis TaxID=221902 RepID=UPI003CED09AC